MQKTVKREPFQHPRRVLTIAGAGGYSRTSCTVEAMLLDAGVEGLTGVYKPYKP